MAFWSGLGFAIGSVVTVVWYLVLLNRYSLSESGAILLWLGAAGSLGLCDFGLSVWAIGVVSELVGSGQISCVEKLSAAIRWQTFFIFSSAAAIFGGVASYFGWIDGFSWEQIPAFAAFVISAQLILIEVSVLKGLRLVRDATIVQVAAVIITYGFSIPVLCCVGSFEVVTSCMAIWSSVSVVIVTAYCRIIVRKKLRGVVRESVPRSILFIERMSGSIKLFPQMVAGIFFAHTLRFLVAAFSGLSAVTLVTTSFMIASRLHALANAFIEVLYPMARVAGDAGISLKYIYMRIWLILFPPFAIGAGSLAFVFASSDQRFTELILLFSLGTWMAVLGAPRVHIANAAGRGIVISIISIGMIVLFSGLCITLTVCVSMDLRLYAICYLIAQAAATLTMPKIEPANFRRFF